MAARRSALSALLRCGAYGEDVRIKIWPNAALQPHHPCRWLPAACRAAAAAAAAPSQAAGLPAAAGQTRVLATLPSLLGWNPPSLPLADQQQQQQQRRQEWLRRPGGSRRQLARRFTAAAARCGLLSDHSAHITPTIETQLQRILQRRGELEKLLLDVNRHARLLKWLTVRSRKLQLVCLLLGVAGCAGACSLL